MWLYLGRVPHSPALIRREFFFGFFFLWMEVFFLVFSTLTTETESFFREPETELFRCIGYDFNEKLLKSWEAETGFTISMPKNKSHKHTRRMQISLVFFVCLLTFFLNISWVLCLLHPRQWHFKKATIIIVVEPVSRLIKFRIPKNIAY